MNRKTPFVNGEFYHIYNRGVDKRQIFLDRADFDRFLQSMIIFNTTEPVGSILEYFVNRKFGRPMSKSKLVNIICYCLNPNHFHLLLEQRENGGLGEFIRRVGSGYTKYFNHKHKRSGVLLQGGSKSVHINSNEYLLHVSAYINLNNKVHRLQGNLFRSSWGEYLNPNRQSLCAKGIILKQFKNPSEYKDFAESSLKDILERKEMAVDLQKMLFE